MGEVGSGSFDDLAIAFLSHLRQEGDNYPISSSSPLIIEFNVPDITVQSTAVSSTMAWIIRPSNTAMSIFAKAIASTGLNIPSAIPSSMNGNVTPL